MLFFIYIDEILKLTQLKNIKSEPTAKQVSNYKMKPIFMSMLYCLTQF